MTNLKINPERIGNRHPSITPFDAFACNDRLLVICCGNDVLFGHLCDTLGLPDLAKDQRFDSNAKRNANQQALKDLLEGPLRQDTAVAWRTKLEKQVFQSVWSLRWKKQKTSNRSGSGTW